MKLFKRALAAVVSLCFTTSLMAQVLPSTDLLTGSTGIAYSSPNTWQDYSINFTPTSTGSNYIGFAFRQDPAYWTIGNIGLTTGGGSNLLINPDFATGGTIPSAGLQAPQYWGVWYQNGTTPAAAGTWQAPGTNWQGVVYNGGLGVNTSTAGSWIDGAVGSFDGIYQGVGLTAGTTYSITFSVYGNNAVSSGVQIGVYGGACSDLSAAANLCTMRAGTGFTTLATPADGGSAGSSSPTIVSSTTTNSVSTSTSNGATSSVTSAALGTAATVIALANARQGQTSQALTIRQTATATTTTPVTYTTVATTPVTTTTTTTPVTTDTYSDGSTVVTNGTPTVTTSTANSVVTTTTSGVLTEVATNNKDYSTRIDQYSKLSNINNAMNYNLDSNVLDRNRVLADGFNVSERNNFYVTGSASQSNTVGGYSYKSTTYGVGYDWQVAKDWVVGGQINRGQANLNGAAGTNAGGSLNKDHVGIYSAYTVNDWILKNDIGYATNTFDTNHSLPELAMSNTSSTKGQDLWATARVYTPEMFDLRPFVGVRNETNRRNGVVESGTALTSMTYGAVNSNKTSTDVGVRYDTTIATDWRVTGEYAYNSQQFNTAYASVGYAIDPTSVVRLRYGYGKQYDYTVQSAMVEARFNF